MASRLAPTPAESPSYVLPLRIFPKTNFVLITCMRRGSWTSPYTKNSLNRVLSDEQPGELSVLGGEYLGG